MLLHRSMVHRSVNNYDNLLMTEKGVRKIETECWEFITDLGDRLRALREKHKWTLEECENRGYPSWRHLRDVEAGIKNLSLSTLLRLANLYEVKPSDLLKGIELKKFSGESKKTRK